MIVSTKISLIKKGLDSYLTSQIEVFVWFETQEGVKEVTWKATGRCLWEIDDEALGCLL